MTEENKKYLREKKESFDRIGKAISDELSSIDNISLDIFYTDDEDSYYEFIVVTFKGGAIGVANASINSLTADVEELSKMLNGNCYGQVKWYHELKANSKQMF